MEEKRLACIVVNSVNYGETDRIVTLLNREEGRLSIKIRGVRKANSKLRFATQPFTYANYLLSPTKGGYVVVGCDTIDRFSRIPLNLGAYYVATFVAEVGNSLSAEEYADPELFDLILSSLKELNENEYTDYPLYALRFLLRALTVAGHALNDRFGVDDLYFSYENGGFIPVKDPYCVKLTPQHAAALKTLILGGEPPRSCYERLFELLAGYYTTNVQKKLRTHLEIVKMMDVL